MARSEECEIAKRVFSWKSIQSGVEEKLGNCVCIVNFAPDLGKPAFLILRNENMRVPWPGEAPKIQN